MLPAFPPGARCRHSQVESERLERQVKWEFEKLHKFLWDEEQALLAQIREETGQKQDLIHGKMGQLAEASQALLNEAAHLQADLKQDDVTFLMVIPTGIPLPARIPPPLRDPSAAGIPVVAGISFPGSSSFLFQTHKNRKRR